MVTGTFSFGEAAVEFVLTGVGGVAIGLAAANAGGLTQHFGTWGKGIHAGNTARAGVTSALNWGALAAAG